MPIHRILFCLFCLSFQTALFAGEHIDDWFLSPMVQSPLRIDQLSGDKIVDITRSPYSIPLLFPKSVSIFDRLDGSLNRFYTLEELATNPALRPHYRFHSNAVSAREKKSSNGTKRLNLSEREKQLFDTSILLIPKDSNPLPSDAQLKAFLDEGRQRNRQPISSKQIIDSLLRDEYADNPVVSLLNESPEAQKVLKSESFNQSNEGLFNSANLALRQPSHLSKTEKYSQSLPDPPSRVSSNIEVESLKSDGPTILKLKARKPSRDGTLKPAQASEIYLTTQGLKELLKDLTKDPAVSGEVRSVAELWAKAEKNGSQNPEIALGVKSILLSAKVGRARTDPYGQASMENLSPDDKYFVIGIDKDIETDVVTIWSKEVEVAPGENLVELSSTDIIYQE